MNYLKNSGQFVCKMALLFAFVFAACSENNTPIAGGTVEETGVYALAGRAGDVYPKLLVAVDENLMLAPKGSSITVYELDALTFDTTGRSFAVLIDNDEGRFVFNSLDLNGPYVLIEEYEPPRDTCKYVSGLMLPQISLETQCLAYTIPAKKLRAIVDLQKNKNISVNSLTTAKVPLLQKYIAEEKTFAEASQMAERKVLEDLGIFEDLDSFEKMFDDDSELSYVNKLIQYTEKTARDGLDWTDVVSNYSSSRQFVRLGQTEKYYQNLKKMIDYKIGFLAKVDGLGQCTEARENDVGEIAVPNGKNYVNVVCRSGKWVIGFKSVEYTKGLLVDNRDGKSYKTVTYNWGNVVQTWMAENLAYTDVTHSVFDDDRHNRYDQYSWWNAMNVKLDDIKVYWIRAQGDTVYLSQECQEAFAGVLDSASLPPYETCVAGLDSEGRWDYDYANPELQSNLNVHQGICPDGWRIPTTNDWKTLLQNLGGLYGVDYVKAVPVLYDETATGFGLKSSVGLTLDDEGRIIMSGFGDFYNGFAVTDLHLSRVNFFSGISSGYGFGFTTPTELQYNERSANIAPFDDVNVRCIKN